MTNQTTPDLDESLEDTRALCERKEEVVLWSGHEWQAFTSYRTARREADLALHLLQRGVRSLPGAELSRAVIAVADTAAQAERAELVFRLARLLRLLPEHTATILDAFSYEVDDGELIPLPGPCID